MFTSPSDFTKSPPTEKSARHPSPDKCSFKDQSYKPRAQALWLLSLYSKFFWPQRVELAPVPWPAGDGWARANTACIQAPVTLHGGHYYHLLLVCDSWLLFSWMSEPSKFSWITHLVDQGWLGALQVITFQYKENGSFSSYKKCVKKDAETLDSDRFVYLPSLF